jgi:hypothetical protein
MGKPYTTLEPLQDRTTQYMRTRRHHTELGGTHLRWHGEYIYTDAKENTAHLSSAPNANPHSQTHTFWGDVDSPLSSESNDTTVPSDSSFNTYRNRAGANGPSYMQTWDTNPLPSSPTSNQTSTPHHTPTTMTSNTQHKKAYKTTSQTTRTTHKLYPNTSYTISIDPNTTNQTSLWR